jgi:hypothetical protein
MRVIVILATLLCVCSSARLLVCSCASYATPRHHFVDALRRCVSVGFSETGFLKTRFFRTVRNLEFCAYFTNWGCVSF